MTSQYFLLTRDLKSGKTKVLTFTRSDAALRAYAKAERGNLGEDLQPVRDVEIVLIEGDDLKSVEQSYPHYFDKGTRELRRAETLRHLRLLAAT